MCLLPEFCRLLALALLNYSDDHGYFWANPVLIRGALFPFEEDARKIKTALMDLARITYLEIGTCPDGRRAGRICNFGKHQRVDKPQRSEIQTLVKFGDQSGSDLELFGEDDPPKLQDLIPPPTAPVAPIQKRERTPDLVFEALAAAEGAKLASVTDNERGKLNKALAQIRKVESGVTPERIWEAVQAWNRKYPGTAVTCMAIAGHWSKLTRAPETAEEAEAKAAVGDIRKRARKRLTELEDDIGPVPVPKEGLSPAELDEVKVLRKILAKAG